MTFNKLLGNHNISTLVDLLRYRAETQPEKTAYIFLVDGENKEIKLTYGELDKQARALAVELKKQFQPGERALLLYPPGLEFISAFFGALYAGIIAVPCYPPDPNRLVLSMAKLQTIIVDSTPKVILTTKEFLDLAAFIFPDYPDLKKLNWIASDIVDTAADEWKQGKIKESDLAFLQYTSGSTGNPKGVMVSHGNIIQNIAMMYHACKYFENMVIVNWLPLYHDLGLIGNMIATPYVGNYCVLISPVDFLKKPIRWLQAISKYRATSCGAPNFAYDLCVKKVTPEQLSQLDLSCWELAVNAAEPVRENTIKNFTDTFGVCGFRQSCFFQAYGMAEATLYISGKWVAESGSIATCVVDQKSLRADKIKIPENKAHTQTFVSAGEPCLGQKVIIVDPETLVQAKISHVGEIWVSSPSMPRGYWNRPNLTKETFQACLSDTGEGPFLRTGDLGFIQDGELFLTGRSKDLIIIRGHNHYPQDIELTVEQCHESLRPGCGAAFSVEVENEERLIVVQELQIKGVEKTDPEEIIKLIRQSVTMRHGLDIYVVVLIKSRSIPKTSSGKIQRRACKNMFLNKKLKIIADCKLEITPKITPKIIPSKVLESEPPKSASTRVIQDWIVNAISRSTGIPVSEISLQEAFSNYSMDSLKTVSLMGELEEFLGISLSPTLMYAHPNIEELSRYLSNDSKGREFLTKQSYTRDSKDEIAIIGVHGVMPGSENPDEFWKHLKKGSDLISEIPKERWDWREYYGDPQKETNKSNVKWGGFIDNISAFDAAFFNVSPREAVLMDPQQRLFLQTVWSSLEDAGYAPENLTSSKVGVFAGVSTQDYGEVLKDYQIGVEAYSSTGMAHSVLHPT